MVLGVKSPGRCCGVVFVGEGITVVERAKARACSALMVEAVAVLKALEFGMGKK